jgi:hypothetical protein
MARSKEPVTRYLSRLEKALQARNATEHTHRPALKDLLEELGSKITATNEPKRSECGAPDYVVTRNTQFGPLTIGYVEAKDVGQALDESEHGEQLKRYRKALPNLILTDYLEFRWYIDGDQRATARLATPAKNKLKPAADGEAKVLGLLRDFLGRDPEPITKPRELAERMARLTHMVRDIIFETFAGGRASQTLKDLRQAFAKALIPDLDQPKKAAEFADMYAQTLAYGLFAARCNHSSGAEFRRLGAAAEIPKTNPFLRTLFNTITGPDLNDEPYAGFVDDIVSLLNHTKMEAVLEQFGKRTRQEDPVVHFYETFLAAYDPKLREACGVYYTPEPVVSYIVRSVDHLLKTRFDCPGGLADTSTVDYQHEVEVGNKVEKKKATSPRVLILDPACGTGTFLYSVVDRIREQFMAQGNAGMWSGYVKNHLLPRIFGFELLMAPYAVAHLKLGMQLAGQDLTAEQRRKWAYDFSGDERLGVFLTNTLEEAERKAEDLFGPLRVITDEAHGAARIKRDLPIMVVIGNPPYSGHSFNRSYWMDRIPPGGMYNGKKVGKRGRRIKHFTHMGKLHQDYYMVDGEPLGERNSKWLQNDYVKFIRFGQWRIDCTGEGVLAFITDNSYLDNPTFRGMRSHLLHSFNDIYLLNLHGNYKKKESSPDGSPDKNVFDITEGVCIGLFVRSKKQSTKAEIHYADLWGTRERKYAALLEGDIAETKWTRLTPAAPTYLFVPRSEKRSAEYHAGWMITDVMPVNSAGIVTARDNLTVRWSRDEAWATAREFAGLPVEKARETYELGEDAEDWTVESAQDDVRKSGPAAERVAPLLYRPFDDRYTYYTGRSRGYICRPRAEVMRHILSKENVGLTWTRPMSPNYEFSVLAARALVDQCVIGNKSAGAGISYLAPLYLYPNGDLPKSLFDHEDGRRPNLSEKFIAEFSARLKMAFVPDGQVDRKKTFGPEDVFHYIYAVFHAPTYRSRYAEFLRSDFPYVPLTSDARLFQRLCELGTELVSFHLLESRRLAQLITRYPITGESEVAKGHPKYLPSGEKDPETGKALTAGRVYISADDPKNKKKGQYFEGVPPEVWGFHIGGYRVCEKWIKDRQGRQLSFDDLTHYQKVVVALKETIRLMAEIDAAIPNWPIK